MKRPTGVTVLAILAAILGVFGIFGGLVLVMGSAAVGVLAGSAALGTLGSVVGFVLLISAIADLAIRLGCLGAAAVGLDPGHRHLRGEIVLGVFQLFNGNPGLDRQHRHRGRHHLLPVPAGGHSAAPAG